MGTTPYNWKDLISSGVNLGVKALGNKLVPPVDQQQANNTRTNNLAQNQLDQQKINALARQNGFSNQLTQQQLNEVARQNQNGTLLGQQQVNETARQNNTQNQLAQEGVTNALQQNQFGNQLALQKQARADQVRTSMMPSMYTNLGYSPDRGRQMADAYAAVAAKTPNPGQGYDGAPSERINQTAPNVGTVGTYELPKGTVGSEIPVFGTTSSTGSGTGSGVGSAGSGKPGLGSTLGKTALGVGASILPSLLTMGSAAAGTIAGLASNPITLAAAAALAGGLIWKSTQVHPTADKWVQTQQAPFDQKWAALDKSGLPPDQLQAAKTQSAQNYLTALGQFAQLGSKQATVAKQAATTFRQYYGDPSQYGVQLPF